MQSNKTCALVEQYLNYLTVIKGRSPNTIHEYRVDLLSLFAFVDSCNNELHADFSYVDIHFISVITLNDMYAFISYCQKQFNSSLGTRARKIVSISQLWKYLKTKVHLIENNIAEEFETPKQPKRIPKYLILDESVRLLIECKTSPRDNCMITIFLNCALRLSELVNLNADQINGDVLSIIGNGNKERKIFLTPAVKQSLSIWMQIRSQMSVSIKCSVYFTEQAENNYTFCSEYC